MTDRPLVMVSFSLDLLASVAAFQPPRSVVLIEEPDVVRKRRVRARVGALPQLRELIEWEYQLDGAAEQFVRAHPDLRPAAVGPQTEYATPFAARLAEHYGLPGAGVAAADCLRDKATLRRMTREAGIANPESVAVDGPQAVREFMAAHPGAVVLKPANRQGSVGTMIVRAAAEVEWAWAECVEQDEGVGVPDRPFPLRMLVERYVSGWERSVEMLVDRGVPMFSNVTDKMLIAGPRPVELGHVVPATMPVELDALLRRQTELVLRAVSFGTGFAHCEWIVSDGVPYLVECAGRFPGGAIVELIEHAYEVELVRSFWSLMKGEQPPELLRSPSGAAAIRFVVAEPGEVLSVGGLDDARAVPGVIRCQVVEPGDRVLELRSSWDRIGYAVASAPTPAEAARRAEEAVALVRVEVAPVPPRVAP